MIFDMLAGEGGRYWWLDEGVDCRCHCREDDRRESRISPTASSPQLPTDHVSNQSSLPSGYTFFFLFFCRTSSNFDRN